MSYTIRSYPVTMASGASYTSMIPAFKNEGIAFQLDGNAAFGSAVVNFSLQTKSGATEAIGSVLGVKWLNDVGNMIAQVITTDTTTGGTYAYNPSVQTDQYVRIGCDTAATGGASIVVLVKDPV